MDPSELKAKSERENLAEDYGEALPGPVPTLCSLLMRSANAHPDNTALVCLHQPRDFMPERADFGPGNGQKDCLRWTYAQLQNVSDLFAAGLTDNGVLKGNVIGAFLYNESTWAVALWAAAKLACPFVPLSPRMLSNSRQLQHTLELAKIEVVIVSDDEMAANFERNASKSIPRPIPKITVDGPPRSGWMGMTTLLRTPHAENVLCSRMPEINAEDTALVLFTSGTTALPKGCAHTHKGLTTAIRARVKALNLQSSSKACVHSPLFHAAGLLHALNIWAAGGAVVHPASTFDAAAVLQAVELEGCTDLTVSPSALQALLKQFSLAPTSTRSLKYLQVGASVVLSKDVNTAREVFGVEMVQLLYGLTEGNPITATSRAKALKTHCKYPVRVGNVCAEARLRICAPNSVKVLRRGEIGEVHIGGPHVIKRYLGGESDDVFYNDDQGSWHISGDQGMMDIDGELSILGRYKDIIISGALNISPAAIEAVLQSVASLNAQVVGVKDDSAGEVPVAVLSEPMSGSISALNIRQAVVEELGAHCAPVQLIDLTQLGLVDFPRTSTGKVRKSELAAAVESYRLETRKTDEERRERSVYKTVTAIWAELLGVQTQELTQETVTMNIADSLTSMSFLNKVEKSFGFSISMRDLLQHSKIAEQTLLIESLQGEHPSPTKIWKERNGPPSTVDMAHTLGIELRGLDSQREIELKTLQPLGLFWKDVEDVLPVYDVGRNFLRTGKRGHRDIWITHKASVCDVRNALEATLANHPMLRTTAAVLDPSTTVHIVIRSSPQWINQIISEHSIHLVCTSDLESFRQSDPELWVQTDPCPLVRAVIVYMSECHAAGLVLQMNHSTFDATSIALFYKDLDAALNFDGKDRNVSARIPYKVWADSYFNHRSSAQAAVTLNYHIDRLKSLPEHTASLFPKYPSPNLEQKHDVMVNSVQKVAATESPANLMKVVPSQITEVHLACPRLSTFCREHNMPAAIVVKTSLAILNARQTGHPHAIFMNTQAGRSWPFLEDWIADRLPNPVDIAGPSYEYVINLVEIKQEEVVLDLLARMQTEQGLLTKHCHAPLEELGKHFNLVGQNLSEESKAHLRPSETLFGAAMLRQVFNWLTATGTIIQGQGPYKNIHRLQLEESSSVDLMWNCRLINIDGETMLSVFMLWNPELLHQAQIGNLLEELGMIVNWIIEEGHSSKTVGECCNNGDSNLMCKQAQN